MKMSISKGGTKVTLTLPAVIIEHSVPKIRNIFSIKSNGKDDNRKEERNYEVHVNVRTDDDGEKEYSFPPNIPEGIQDLIRLGYSYQVPPGTPCSVQVGIYMRKSSMKINPASEQVGRMIVNLLTKEVYKLNPLTNDVNIPARDPMIEANTFFLLAPKLITNYQLIVSSNPQISSKESNINSIRLANYERITIIIDYHVDDKTAEKISKFAYDILSNKQKLNEIAGQFGGKVKKSIIKPSKSKNNSIINKNEMDEIDDDSILRQMGKLNTDDRLPDKIIIQQMDQARTRNNMEKKTLEINMNEKKNDRKNQKKKKKKKKRRR